jgi:hypothetical protein
MKRAVSLTTIQSIAIGMIITVAFIGASVRAFKYMKMINVKKIDRINNVSL